MSRRASKFRQSELSRAIKAVEGAGLHVCRIEVEPDGKIVVLTDGRSNGTQQSNTENEWDAVL